VLDSLVDPVFTVILLSLYMFTNKYHHQIHVCPYLTLHVIIMLTCVSVDELVAVHMAVLNCCEIES